MRLPLACVAALALTPALSTNTTPMTPMDTVVTMLKEMASRTESAGKNEQMVYDRYACWCENILERKAAAIDRAAPELEELQRDILKLSGEIGVRGADVKNLRAEIASNLESQKEAAVAREKQSAAYHADRSESEQCIGSLEAAIRVLSGGNKAFLERRVELLSVVAGVRGVLDRSAAMGAVSDKDLQLVRRFVAGPEVVFGGRSSSESALQTESNPYGDFAPQSTQIDGILKGMYDTFAGGLEKSNAEEAKAQKAFEELAVTKQTELQTLQAALDRDTTNTAEKRKSLTDSKTLRDDTKAALDADEYFFAETKSACKAKAAEWSQRSMLRSEELSGVHEAIQILSSQREALQKATVFVQMAATTHKVSAHSSRTSASAKLSALATSTRSADIALIALAARQGGHFDRIAATIDKMIAALRQEGQEDVEHRDRCQQGSDKNQYDREDLEAAIAAAGGAVDNLKNRAGTLQTKLYKIEGEVSETKHEIKEALSRRNEEVKLFKQDVKDVTTALSILNEAMQALRKFYKRNRIPIALLSTESAETPDDTNWNYTMDKDKAPDTEWSGGDYRGSHETPPILSVLQGVVERFERDLRVARQDDAEAEKRYELANGALNEALLSQTAIKIQFEKGIADGSFNLLELEELKISKGKALSTAEAEQDVLRQDCDWVANTFDTRRTKREKEIQGLIDAKGYLGGAENDG